MDVLDEQFQQLDLALRGIQQPLLVIHPKPDTDALGAVFSLAEFLKKNGKKVTLFSVDQPAKYLCSLFPIDTIEDRFNLEKHDSIIFLDRGDVFFKMKFDYKVEACPSCSIIINIDHHPQTIIPGALNVIDTKAAATSEIIYRFFEYVGYEVSPTLAQYILNGIYGDTGGFRHNNTTPLSLEIASKLMRKGASITKVNKHLFANKSLNTLKLWGIALERARINPKTGMVVSFITEKDLAGCHTSADDISGISEILNTIAGSKFSLVLSQREQNKIKASLRSEEYKGIDVSKIAQQFQGGGHKLASGFEIQGKLRQEGDNWVIE